MKKLKALGVTLLIVSGLIYLLIPTVRYVPDTPESQEIQALIQRVYLVHRDAMHNGGDVSAFDEVFMDSPLFPLEGKEAIDFVAQVYGEEAAARAGYLTAIKAKYKAFGINAQLVKEAKARARQEGRVELTAEEEQQIMAASYRVPLIYLGPDTAGRSEVRQPEFFSVLIFANLAVARFDDGAALQRAVLFKQDGQWRIATIKFIQVHF
jgi:hypothetical protein